MKSFEGVDDFQAWKYIVMLILEKNYLVSFFEQYIEEPEGDEAIEKYKKDLINAQMIIVDSIKNHLIPHVSTLKNPKKMMDALSHLFEGKNINHKMTFIQTSYKSSKQSDKCTL
jgi:hypothetical protein